MARPRSYHCEALVLKSTPTGEAGLVVTLLTSDAGKLRAVVRGVRKPTSRMVGHLEPITRLELALARSRPGGLDTITQAQVLESFANVRSSLDSLSRAIYLAELVDGFGAEGSPNHQLYALLLDALRSLNSSSYEELVLRCFELHLLKCSGFMPELYRCVECSPQLTPGEHQFSPEVGGTLCPNCHPPGARIIPLSVQALKVLRLLDKVSLPDLPKLRIPGSLAEELKHVLSVSLNYWLDKEIRSKSFMERLEHSRTAGIYV